MIAVRIALTCWFCLGVLLTIGQIGKPRGPVTSGVASVSAITTALIVWAVWVL